MNIPLPRWEFEVSRRQTTHADVSNTKDLKYFDTDYVLNNSEVLVSNKHEYIVLESRLGVACHQITKRR